ncbi:Flagellar Member 7 [Trypanosoma cruzi]|uniref:Flagellar Member 7 n=1 Tax=Trypanosoma cruzi TaxID=5693 RepID=A0A2V2VHQ1_TRYCR|nr:Flagellar Member 7 [Trypanosoma cruzi]
MSVTTVRRGFSFDPAAGLTGKETYQDAVRMEIQAATLEAAGKNMECLQLLEKALQVRCQERPMSATMPMYIDEVCDAAERLITKTNAYGVKCFKEDDYETASVLFDYGMQMTEADSFPLRESDDRRRYLRGVTLNNYGCMERRRGHFSEALSFMQHSMKCTGEQSPVAFLNISAVQTQLRLCEEAVESAMRAMQNLGSVPEESALLAAAHHNLAVALEPLDATRALEEYQSALSVAQQTMGLTNETTLAIEKNMMRFLQAHKMVEAESCRVATAGHIFRGSIRGGKLSLHQARQKSPLRQSKHPELEPKDIFPHPFVLSAADPVVQRKVNATPMYHPPRVQRRSPALLASTKRLPLKKDEPEHTYSQVRKDQSFVSRSTPPRRQETQQRQTPPKPSRLPPVASSFQGPARNSNFTAPAGRSRHVQEGGRVTPKQSAVTPPMRKLSTIPLPGISSNTKGFGKSATGKGVPVVKGSHNVSAPLSKTPARSTAANPTTPQFNRHSTNADNVRSPLKRQSTNADNVRSPLKRHSANADNVRSPLKRHSANADNARTGFSSSKISPKYSKKDSIITSPVDRAKPLASNVPSAVQSKTPRSIPTQAKSAVHADDRSRNLGTGVGHAKSAAELSARASVVSRGLARRAELDREGRPSTYRASLERSPIATDSVPREGRASRVRSLGNNLISYMADRLDMLLVDEEELERKQASASIIQRAYRVYRARKLLKEMRENRGSNHVLREIGRSMATRKIQRWFRRRLHARWGTRRRVAKREVLASEQHKAAIRIQSRARGWLARRKFRRLKNYEKNSGHAALKVQSWWRQILAKRRLATLKRRYASAKAIAVEKERRELAVTVIQSHWRRRKAERETRVERMKARELRRKINEARRRNAAEKIKTWWRLLVARAELQRLREAQAAREARLREHQRKIDAATKLQAFGRMLIIKREAEPLLTTARLNAARAICTRGAESQAALKIQRAFRGYYAKRQLKKLRRERRRRLEEARWGALVTVAQRIGRGFHFRQKLGRTLREMKLAAIEFCQRERALELADRARESTFSEPEPAMIFMVRGECSAPAICQPLANVLEGTETLLPVSDSLSKDVNNMEETPNELGAAVPDTKKIIRMEETPREEHSTDLTGAVQTHRQKWGICQDGGVQNECLEMKADEGKPFGPQKADVLLMKVEGGNETRSKVSHVLQYQVGEEGVFPTVPSVVSEEMKHEERAGEEPLQEQGTTEHSERESIREEGERLKRLSVAICSWEEEKLRELAKTEEEALQEQGTTEHSERESIREEGERLKRLSVAICSWEEEKLRELAKTEEEALQEQGTTEHSESESIREEGERLKRLSVAICSWEEEKLRELAALEQRLAEGELRIGTQKLGDSDAAVEVSRTRSCITSDAAVCRTSTPESSPTPVHMPLSTLAPTSSREEGARKLGSLEEALAIEREKRRCAMANEKRLREARDAICIKANEYRLRKIAAAESPEELKSLVPHPPLTRRRKDLRTPTPTYPVPSLTALQIRREQQAWNAERKKEMAALNITRVARGYLCRQYFRVLKAIMMEYVEHRLDIDREEPPVLDHELLDRFTMRYRGEVEQARLERCITITQAFTRAAGSEIMTANRMGVLKIPQAMSSKVHYLDNSSMTSLKGFLRIVLAKKEIAARKQAVHGALHQLKQVEATATLNDFACVVQAKTDRMARSRAVRDYLQEMEVRDAVQMRAVDKIVSFLLSLAARKELYIRKKAFRERVQTEEAARKVLSFMQICHAKKKLWRLRLMAGEKRTMDTNVEEFLEHAALQVQRAYRSYRARRLAEEQRNAKEKHWNTIQAQEEEITAAMTAIAADAADPTELWASLGCPVSGEVASEPDSDVEELVRFVVLVQQWARGWIARRRVNELCQRHERIFSNCGKQEEDETSGNESDHEA